MTKIQTIIYVALFAAGIWNGYWFGWTRACRYRDNLEAKFPRTRA